MLYTARPRNVELSVPAGTLALALKLSADLGTVKGCEILAPGNWCNCMLSFDAAPLGMTNKAGIKYVSTKLNARLTARVGGKTHAVRPRSKSAQSCRKASTAVQPEVYTLLINSGARWCTSEPNMSTSGMTSNRLHT